MIGLSCKYKYNMIEAYILFSILIKSPPIRLYEIQSIFSIDKSTLLLKIVNECSI